MSDTTSALIGITLANFVMIIALGTLMRSLHKRERDAEIREAWARSPHFTRQWLNRETDVLPERVIKD